MALTPDDIVNRTFETTRFRDGYDQDEVDTFLDEIVVEFRSVLEEKERLEARVRELESGAPAAAEVPAEPVVEAPEAPVETSAPAAPVAAEPEAPAPAAEPSGASPEGLLALAQRVHDEHVAEGERRAAELVAAGEAQATEIEETAAKRRVELDRDFEKTSKDLERQKTQLQAKIDELQTFERDYRLKLRGYIESQLRDLDRSSFALGGASTPAPQ